MKRLFSVLIYGSRIARAVYLIEVFLSLVIGAKCGLLEVGSADLWNFVKFAIFFQWSYYAVYLINDLIDYPSDKKNSGLSHKPLVTGILTHQEAVGLALGHLLTGWLGLYVTSGVRGLLISVFIVAYNLVYTLWLKRNFMVRLFANGFTHAYRVAIPFLLFARYPGVAYLVVWLWFWFFTAVVVAFRRVLDGHSLNLFSGGVGVASFLGISLLFTLPLCYWLRLGIIFTILLLWGLWGAVRWSDKVKSIMVYLGIK